MKFVIRDDDTCAMTSPDELANCYAEIWDEVPICLSVTPFRVEWPADSGIPDVRPGPAGSAPRPLEENRELVEFLREGIAAGRLHIALHGYHHETPGDLPEFVAGEDLHRKARHGKEYLEALLACRIRTFVPPNNGLSKEGYAAVIGAGLNVVNRQNYSRMNLRALDPHSLLELACTLRYSLLSRLGREDGYLLRAFPRYTLAPYFTVGPSVSLPEIQAHLRRCPTKDGVFILATHYHAFERKMLSGESIRAGIFALIDQARRIPGTEFATYDDLW